MNTLIAIASLVRSIVAVMPGKGWLILFGLILGVPTSIYGFQWAAYKVTKQAADCNNDVYYEIAKSSPATPQQQLDAITKALDKHSECFRSISPQKGTVEFLNEQHARHLQR